jgi:hypothetical protein
VDNASGRCPQGPQLTTADTEDRYRINSKQGTASTPTLFRTVIKTPTDSSEEAISDVAADATAFPRRDGTQYCIQYYSSWTRAADTPTHVAQVTKVYAAMRPFMPGASYVNYCDLDCRTIPTPIGATT